MNCITIFQLTDGGIVFLILVLLASISIIKIVISFFTYIELIKMILKNNLKEVRQKNGLTQEELGNYVGVSRQTIISIERYRYKPTLELAMKNSSKKLKH